ncbi:MAG: GNAT family N-acetyltransferase [Panacibacter sp.]
MDKFFIRLLNEADVNMLQRMSIETFVDTYGVYNTAENMQLHINQHFNTQQLLSELLDKSNYFFAAFNGDEPAGYEKLRTSENPQQLIGRKHIELERIYVLRDYQGMGLGYKMIRYCLDFASVKSYELLWLGVWNQNKKAVQFYTKCGFEIFGEQAFMLGTDEQVDWLMKKELNYAG